MMLVYPDSEINALKYIVQNSIFYWLDFYGKNSSYSNEVCYEFIHMEVTK